MIFSNPSFFAFSITGQPAFTHQRQDMELRDQILQGNYTMKEKYWEHLPDGMLNPVRNIFNTASKILVDNGNIFNISYAMPRKRHTWSENGIFIPRSILIINGTQ